MNNTGESLMMGVCLAVPLLTIFFIVKKWRAAAIVLYVLTLAAFVTPQIGGKPNPEQRLRIDLMRRVSPAYQSLIFHLQDLSEKGLTQELAKTIARLPETRSPLTDPNGTNSFEKVVLDIIHDTTPSP